MAVVKKNPKSASRSDSAAGECAPIWNKPKIKKILSQPVGEPIRLTREEARAIVESINDGAAPPLPPFPPSAQRRARQELSESLGERAEP